MHAAVQRAQVRHRALAMVSVAAMLWGTSGLTAAGVYDRGVHPMTVSAWRMAIGAIALAVMLRRGGRPAARPTRQELSRLLLVGTSLAAYQACYFLAVERAGVSVATLLALGLAPVLVAVGERLITRRAIAPATRLGLVLAGVGLSALVGVPSAGDQGLRIGAVLAATAACGYATLTLASGTLSMRFGAQRLTVIAFAVAALVLVPATSLTVGLGLGGDVTVVAAMLYLGIVPTAIAYRLFFAGLRWVAASTAAVLVLLEPLVASALAVALLGERLGPAGWFGAVTLVTAVLTVSASSRGGRQSALHVRDGT